jgi:hypothetical protein
MPGWKGLPTGLKCKSHSIWLEESQVKAPAIPPASALATVRADLLLIFSKDWPSLHPDAFPRNSSPSPYPERQEARLELWHGDLINQGGFSLSLSFILGNSSDQVLKDSLPQAVLSWKMVTSRVSGLSHWEGDNLGFRFSCCKYVAITLI